METGSRETGGQSLQFAGREKGGLFCSRSFGDAKERSNPEDVLELLYAIELNVKSKGKRKKQ